MKKIYTVLVLAFLLSNNSFAAIRYTYFSDEFRYTDRYYDLDLNGDDDFKFTYQNNGEYAVESMSGNCYYAVDATNAPKAYNAGSGLGTYTWYSGGSYLTYFYGNDKYLAVKFQDGNNVYYGWFYIYQYLGDPHIGGFAYNDVPNQPITPGDKGTTGIADPELNNFALSANTPNTLAFTNCDAFNKVYVYTVDGKLLSEINHPAALQNYNVERGNAISLIAFYRDDKLLQVKKYFVQ